MVEILWHRRETSRQTEKTNLNLNYRATSRLYLENTLKCGSKLTRRLSKKMKPSRIHINY
jgi:hypothetical protein